MFQSFEVSARPEQGPPRLAALRAAMAEAGLDGFMVPRADAHQGEEVPACEERLNFISGFTGSAGAAVIKRDQAALFVDGRYTLQAEQQSPSDLFAQVDITKTTPVNWLEDNLVKAERVAFDPLLHTSSQVKAFKKTG